MPYLNTEEVESALAGLKNQYPDLCRLVELPHQTHEGRTITALHIGKLDEGYRPVSCSPRACTRGSGAAPTAR